MGPPEGVAGGSSGFGEALGHPDVVRDAEAAQILFARVKGFPAWPAQVLSQEMAATHLSGVSHRSTDAPVMFFGTAEIAWIGPRDLVPWGVGMSQKLHTKGRKNDKRFGLALKQVRDYLSLVDERQPPDNWWCPAFPPGSQPSLGTPYVPLAADASASPPAIASGVGSAAAAADAEQAALLAAAAASLMAQKQQQAAWEQEQQQQADHRKQKQQQAKKRAAPLSRRRNDSSGADSDGGGVSSDSDFEETGARARRRPRQRQRFSPDEAPPQRRPRGVEPRRPVKRESRRSGGGGGDSGAAVVAASGPEICQELPSPQQQQQVVVVRAARKHSSGGGGAAGVLGSPDSGGRLFSFSDDGGEDEEEALRRYIAAQAAEAATGAAGWAVTYTSDGHAVAVAAGVSDGEASGDDGVDGEAFEYNEEAEMIAAAAADAAKARCKADTLEAPAAWACAVGPLQTAADAVASRPPAAAAADGPIAPFDAVRFVKMAGLAGALSSTPAAAAAEEVTALPAPHRLVLAGAVLRAQRRGVRPVLGAATAVAAAFPGAFNGYINAAVGRAGAVTAAAAALSDCFAAPPPPVWPSWGGVKKEQLQDEDLDQSEDLEADDEANLMALDDQDEWDGEEEEVTVVRRRPKKPRAQQRRPVAKVRRVQQQEEESEQEEEEEDEGPVSPAERRRASGATPQRRKRPAAQPTAAAADESAPRREPPPGIPAHLFADGPTVRMGDRDGPKFDMVRRNVYSGKDRPKRMARDEIAVCCCSVQTITRPDGSIEHIGCGDNCLNRVMKIHCDPKTCPCGDACSNKPFHMLKSQAMEIFLTTNNRGHGVRAARPITRGEFVVEYAGEVIDSREMRRRMDAQRLLGQHHFYIMGLGPGMFIDAHKRGNLARLLNSSCEPNCETQKWYDAATGEMRVGIFAMRDIIPGEELTYDYMFEHEGGSALAQGFRCMCGAPKCRGTMDVNPERKRDYGRRLEVFWEGDRAWYAGTVTGFFVTSGKHAVRYDDGDTERLDLSEVPHRWLDGDGAGVVQGPTAQVPSGAEPPPLSAGRSRCGKKGQGRRSGASAAAAKEEEESDVSSGDEGAAGRRGKGARRGAGVTGSGRASAAASRRRDSGGSGRTSKRQAVAVSSPERGASERRRPKQRRVSGAAAAANGGGGSSGASTQFALLPGDEEAAMQRLVAAAAAGAGSSAAVGGADAKAAPAAEGMEPGSSDHQHTTEGGLSALELLSKREEAERIIASALAPRGAARRRGRRATDGEALLPVAQLLAGIRAVRADGPTLFRPTLRAEARAVLKAVFGTGACAAAAAAGGAYSAGRYRGLLERVAALQTGDITAPHPAGDAGDDSGDGSDMEEAAGILRRLSGADSLPSPPPLFCAALGATASPAGKGTEAGAVASDVQEALTTEARGAAAPTDDGTTAAARAATAAAETAVAPLAAAVQLSESPTAGDGGVEGADAPEPPLGPPRMDAAGTGPQPVAA